MTLPNGTPTVLDVIAEATRRDENATTPSCLPATGWARGTDAEELDRLAPLIDAWRDTTLSRARWAATICNRQRASAIRAGVAAIETSRPPAHDFTPALGWVAQSPKAGEHGATLNHLVELLLAAQQAISDGDPARAAKCLADPAACEILATAWPVLATNVVIDVDCEADRPMVALVAALNRETQPGGPQWTRAAVYRTVHTHPARTCGEILREWIAETGSVYVDCRFWVTLSTEPAPTVHDGPHHFAWDGAQLTALPLDRNDRSLR